MRNESETRQTPETRSLEPIDYPAAHSMDTTWFALDRDGHVGVFESGEEGPVPNCVGEGDLYREDFEAVVLAGAIPTDFSELTAQPDGKILCYDWLTGEVSELEPGYISDCVLWLRDESAFERKHRGLTRIPDDRHILAFARRPDYGDMRSTIQQLHADGLILRARANSGILAHEYGVYAYDHWDTYMPGPYLLEQIPCRPLHFDDVPEQLAEKLNQCVLDVSFADSSALQPMEVIECSTWGTRSWVELDGTVHTPDPNAEEAGGRHE